MHDFLQSESFGLLLKSATAVSAFAFGMLGLGAETRHKDGELKGKLNRKGWIALIGMAVAGVLAIFAAANDYWQSQVKTKAAEAKDQKIDQLNRDLLVNSQRLLYPLRGVTVEATLRLGKTSDMVAEYTKRLDVAIAKDPQCSRIQAFECLAMGSNGEVYQISETSPLYPKTGTPLRAGLDNLGLAVELIKQTPGVNGGPSSFKNVGLFEIPFGDSRTNKQSIRYAVGNDHVAVIVDGYEIKDSILLESKVPSLVDFMPGALAAGAEVETNSFFHALANINFDIPSTVKIYAPFREAVSLDRVKLTFPYPITISAGRPYSVECGDRDFLARLLPSDPNAPQNFSGLGLPALKLPDADQQRLCSSLVSATNKPVDKLNVRKPEPVFEE
jgi:hypothetical protein